jgi:helicase MOV-10
MRNPKPYLVQTVLCRNRDPLFCAHHARGDCWFAHTEEELRCGDYARCGVCPFLHRCKKRHVLADIPSEPQEMEWGRRPYSTAWNFVVPLDPYVLPREHAKFAPQSVLETRQCRLNALKYLRERFQKCGVERGKLSVSTFRETLHELQYAEELFGLIDLFSYRMEGAQFSRHQSGDLFVLKVLGLAENRPSVLRGDSVKIFVHDLGAWLGGKVHYVNVDELVLSLPESYLNRRQRLLSSKIDVVFVMSRTQESIRHYAIDHGVFLDDAACAAVTTIDQPPLNKARAVRHPSVLNEEQCELVGKAAAKQGARGLMLWGPPGTGKTTTLVAAIAETLAAFSRVRILVCTPSNEAADLIVERLAKYDGLFAEKSEMIRVNGLMRSEKEVPDIVKRFSFPADDGGFRFPTETEVAGARVVVCTLMTSSKLFFSVGVSATHFSHLFVDEAGHATEADLLVATLVCKAAQRIVLAGDHKQLGAMVRCPACITAGMEVSPLERLITCPELAQQYVMLHRNYRSSPAIVRLVNTVYDDKLVPARSHDEPLSLNGVRLPLQDRAIATIDASFPILFLHHGGAESRENDSPSWMNLREAHMLVDMAMVLWREHHVEARDIALLSPYRKQVKKMDGILYNKLSELEQSLPEALRRQLMWDARGRMKVPFKVSTVEAFQGRESRVVLLSSVRNREDEQVDTDVRFGIGFLKQPQRANVALSRARDLLVIAGNAELLHADDLWRRYLERLVAMPKVVFDLTAGGCPMGAFPPAWLQRSERLRGPGQDTLEVAAAANEERPFERHV